MSAASDRPVPAPGISRPEHPRPDFLRREWINLNGAWEFEFDPGNHGEYHGWYRLGRPAFSKTITVPFCWESRLSGVNAPDYRGAAWYRRSFTLPEGWTAGGRRVLLKFGAVDWHARVWLNGIQLGEHEGGYSPFEFDITDRLRPGANDLCVRAFDVTSPDVPSGKQTGWYTRCSGIWQTVWLESVGSAHLETVHLTPDLDSSSVGVHIVIQNRGAAGRYRMEIEPVESDGPRLERRVELVRGANEFHFQVNIRNAKEWSPESPHLYFVRARVRGDEGVLDEVETYFGLRKVHRAVVGDNPREFIHINNRPTYLAGALDQGYNPEGVYTYPSEDYIINDIRKAKEFGFNFLRLHIKVEEPRVLYWADKLGVLLMCDVPNFAHFSQTARAAWQETFDDAVKRDWNHPSIFAWCLFNETWGLQPMQEPQTAFVERMYRHAKALDRTRLIEDHSPCNYDHVVTDINSWHFYINDHARARTHIRHFMERAHEGSGFNYVEGRVQGCEPVINSEFGGIDAGMGDRDISWSMKFLINELRLQKMLCGYVYTELQDIEWEHNGLVRYDRSPKEFGYADQFAGFGPADLNSPDFVCIDSHPCPQVRPGGVFECDIHMSHWSRRNLSAGVLHWELCSLDRTGKQRRFERGEAPIRFHHYSVDRVHRISVRLPDEATVGTLAVWVTAPAEAGADTVIARNYINLDVYAAPPPIRECPDDRTCLLRWDPQGFAEDRWSGGETTLHRDKVAGLGAGRFGYRLRLPQALDAALVESAELVFEGASRAGGGKVDARLADYGWVRRAPSDYPQTDTVKYPTDLTVRINGIAAGTVTLPDDPADARGVLSHAHGLDAGSYGFLTHVRLTGEALDELRRAGPGGLVEVTFEVAADAKNRGGFSLYGNRMGRYPMDPMLVLNSSVPLDRAAIEGETGPAAVDPVLSEVATGERPGAKWRFTTAHPGDGWPAPEYDDSAWAEGVAGFGCDGGNLPHAQTRALRTGWETEAIWLRRDIEMPTHPARVRLRLSHNRDVDVYINGHLVWEARGHVTDYVEAALPGEAVGHFRPGRNTLAVHCRQPDAGRFVDVGLRYALPAVPMGRM